jgi:hypothetical protein
MDQVVGQALATFSKIQTQGVARPPTFTEAAQ